MRIMKLIEATKSTHVEVNRSLLLLKRERIIAYIRFGRNCIIKLNFDNEKTQVLLVALKILDAYDYRHQLKGHDSQISLESVHCDDHDNEFISNKEKKHVIVE
jgi:hypothetical protein